MIPASPLIPWPDPFKILLPASLTHGFHTSFLGVFYLESTITLPLLPAASPVSFILRQFVRRKTDKNLLANTSRHGIKVFHFSQSDRRAANMPKMSKQTMEP